MSEGYQFDRPEVQRVAKPYGFSRVGPELLGAFRQSRARALAQLETPTWSRPSSEATEPAPDTTLGLTTASYLDTVMTSAVTRGEALPAAAAEAVGRLLRKYEAFGRIFAAYGPDGRKRGDDANRWPDLVRLAAAAAWVAHAESQPAARVAGLNITLKIIDRCVSKLEDNAATPDATWLAGAIVLESELVAEWERA